MRGWGLSQHKRLRVRGSSREYREEDGERYLGSEDNYQDGELFRMNSCYASLRCFYFFGFNLDGKVNVLLITRICFENLSMQLDSITCYMQHKDEAVLNCVSDFKLGNSIFTS